MPATRIQIVIDANDPGRLVTFWAAATGYLEEDIDAFVRGLLEAGHVPAEATVEVDGRLRFEQYASLRHPDDPIDDRGVGLGRRILFQGVAEPKTVKDRIHLDLLVGPDARDAEVERLVGLGATVVREVDEPGTRHTVLADPEGNELCVA